MEAGGFLGLVDQLVLLNWRVLQFSERSWSSLPPSNKEEKLDGSHCVTLAPQHPAFSSGSVSICTHMYTPMHGHKCMIKHKNTFIKF